MYKIEGNIIEGIDPFIKFQTIKNPPAKQFVGNEKVIRTGRKSRHSPVFFFNLAGKEWVDGNAR